MSAELKVSKVNFSTSQKKLDFTKKATEQRLVDSIKNPEGFRADPVLIGVYSATLDENEIDFAESDPAKEPRSRKDIFLEMKEKLDPNNTEHNDRFLEVTNMILEKVKTTKHSRIRSESGHRLRSESSKRDRSKEDLLHDRPSSRPRQQSGLPIKQ